MQIAPHMFVAVLKEMADVLRGVVGAPREPLLITSVLVVIPVNLSVHTQIVLCMYAAVRNRMGVVLPGVAGVAIITAFVMAVKIRQVVPQIVVHVMVLLLVKGQKTVQIVPRIAEYVMRHGKIAAKLGERVLMGAGFIPFVALVVQLTLEVVTIHQIVLRIAVPF